MRMRRYFKSWDIATLANYRPIFPDVGKDWAVIRKSCDVATFALSFSICNLKPTAKPFLSRSGMHLTDEKCAKRSLGGLNANRTENGGFKRFSKNARQTCQMWRRRHIWHVCRAFLENRLNPPFSVLFAFRPPKLRFAHFSSVRCIPDRLKNGFAVGFRLQIEKESAKVATSQLLRITAQSFPTSGKIGR